MFLLCGLVVGFVVVVGGCKLWFVGLVVRFWCLVVGIWFTGFCDLCGWCMLRFGGCICGSIPYLVGWVFCVCVFCLVCRLVAAGDACIGRWCWV